MPECVFGALYENYEYILPPSKIERVRSDDSNVAEELQATVWRISCRGLLQITENTLLIPNSVRLNHIFCLHSLRFLQNYREYPSTAKCLNSTFSCLVFYIIMIYVDHVVIFSYHVNVLTQAWTEPLNRFAVWLGSV